VKITQQIHFEFNKDKIRPESFPVLDAVVEALQRNPAIKIEVQGHTDNKGGAAYNKNLSDRRAKSVMQYLLAHGVELSRLTSHGYGFERPLVDNNTEQNRALNRRVQFVRTEGVKEGCPKPAGK
jgi:outer membrane protein OmpA-like peptidoglycan-associated protein